MLQIQQGTYEPIPFLMVDSTDHVTGKTGLTPTVSIWKPGTSFVVEYGTVAEIGNGVYTYMPAYTNTFVLGVCVLQCTAPGADPTTVMFKVIPKRNQSVFAFGGTVKAGKTAQGIAYFTRDGALFNMPQAWVDVVFRGVSGSAQTIETAQTVNAQSVGVFSRTVSTSGFSENGTLEFRFYMADYSADHKEYIVRVNVEIGAVGNGHIPVVASVRSDDRYMVAAQFTKAGVAVQPGSAPTCAADCIVVSDQYPTGHTINFGSLTLQYNSTTKSYYALGTLPSALIGSQAGMLYCKFHTDDATVDAQDVTMAVAANMDIYNPPLVEDVLAAIEAKTRMLGAMSMTLQTPVVTIKEFKIIRGDSYTNDTPFPNRPLQLTCDEVPYDLAALMTTPHAVRVHLKTATDEIVVKPYSVVSQGLNSHAYTIIFGFSDEVTRLMTAGKYEWEVKAYYQRTASPANYDVVTQGKGTYTVEEPVYDGASGPKTPTTG